MIALGDKVRDRITRLEGIVVCESKWINGCHRITIQPQELKDGKRVETDTFDIEELELLEKGVVATKTINITNGPMPNPTNSGR